MLFVGEYRLRRWLEWRWWLSELVLLVRFRYWFRRARGMVPTLFNLEVLDDRTCAACYFI